MIFGFGKKGKGKARDDDDDYADDDIDEEIDYVLFKGAINGRNANLAENARLAQAGLLPTKQLVTDALERRAESIRIEPKGNVAVVAQYIDGVAYPSSRLTKQQSLAVTQMLKLLAGLDIRERSRPQAGGIKAEFNSKEYHLRIEAAPTEAGVERLFIRADDLDNMLETPEKIGFSEELKARVREITAEKSGVLVACGPPRSGTSTTAVGMVKSVDAYLYSIYNLADLGGRELSHITNFEKRPDEDLETLLGRVIRVEADVLFVPPLRNEEIAATVFGVHHKVSLITEMVARDAPSAVAQLTKWLGDAELAADGLKLVVSQKLIRVLCNKCKQAFRPNPKMVAKVGLPPETTVMYRATQWSSVQEQAGEEVEPCSACGGLGYRGRTAMIEAIVMSEGMREVVLAGATPEAIKAQARQENMPIFRTEGLRLVAEGKTSLEELQRAFKTS